MEVDFKNDTAVAVAASIVMVMAPVVVVGIKTDGNVPSSVCVNRSGGVCSSSGSVCSSGCRGAGGVGRWKGCWQGTPLHPPMGELMAPWALIVLVIGRPLS